MSRTHCLVIDAGVQALVIAVVKLVSDAELRVGQAGKNGPLRAPHHCLSSKLGLTVTQTPAAVRGHLAVEN